MQNCVYAGSALTPSFSRRRAVIATGIPVPLRKNEKLSRPVTGDGNSLLAFALVLCNHARQRSRTLTRRALGVHIQCIHVLIRVRDTLRDVVRGL